jgi:Domain of unknown function (DUF6431)
MPRAKLTHQGAGAPGPDRSPARAAPVWGCEAEALSILRAFLAAWCAGLRRRSCQGSDHGVQPTNKRALPAVERPRGLSGVRNPPLSIVWRCGLDVVAYLGLGQQIEVGPLACPGCGRRLGGWGGYWRWVRGPGSARLWIRRGRCSTCARSHALLPDFLLERRLD